MKETPPMWSTVATEKMGSEQYEFDQEPINVRIETHPGESLLTVFFDHHEDDPVFAEKKDTTWEARRMARRLMVLISRVNVLTGRESIETALKDQIEFNTSE